MPQLQAMEIFDANIGPARMTLTSSTKDKITIYPAFYIETTEKAHASIYKDEHGIVTTTQNSQRQVQYVQNVLVVHYGGKNTCIKSKPLYDWLKWGQWKSEFERK